MVACKNNVIEKKDVHPSFQFEVPIETDDINISEYLIEYSVSEIEDLDIVYDIQSINKCSKDIYSIVSADETYLFKVDMINLKRSSHLKSIKGDPITENIFNDIADVTCNSFEELIVYSQGFLSKFNTYKGDYIDKKPFTFNGVDMELDSFDNLYLYSINQQQGNAALDVYQFFTINATSHELKSTRFKETPDISLISRKNIHRNDNTVYLHKNFDDKIYEFVDDSLQATYTFNLFESKDAKLKFLSDVRNHGIQILENYRHSFLGRFSVTDEYIVAQIDLFGKPAFYIVNKQSGNHIYFDNLVKGSSELPYIDFPMITYENQFCNIVDGEKLVDYKQALINLGKSELVPEYFNNIDPNKMYLIKMKFEI